MRILQVTTLVSPNGSYGGPVRVAMNQSAQLQDSGFPVTITAAQSGYTTPPEKMAGVPSLLFKSRKLLPRIGFAGIAAPRMLWWFLQHRREFDVVHVHLARDLVTLPIAMLTLWFRIPLVVQTHGMIDASSNALARPLDFVMTRPVLRGAQVVLYLTEREKQDLSDVASGITLAHLTNGVPVPEQRAEPPATPEMLLIARLHPRKRVTTFIRAAIELLNQGLVATFAVVGPDEGDGPEVRTLIEEAGHGELIRWEGPMAPEAVLARLLRSSVFVLPAVDEPFPMAVLEAMAVALPVIVTDSCGLAPMVDRTGSGMVVTDSRSALVDAMRQMIFDPDGRRSMGGRARDAAAAELGMPAVARRLETIYAAAATHE